MVVTYWDKVQPGEAAEEAIERLAADAGVDFIPLDARRLSDRNRQEDRQSRQTTLRRFQKASLTARAGWRIEPKTGWLEHPHCPSASWLSLLLLSAGGGDDLRRECRGGSASPHRCKLVRTSHCQRSVPRGRTGCEVVLTAQQGEFGYGLLNMGPFSASLGAPHGADVRV